MNPFAHPVPRHVALGEGQRLTADVGGPDVNVRRVVGDGDGDAPTAGADVRHPEGALRITRDLHCPLHEHLGVGIGHQDIGGDLEVQAHELFVSDEVRNRLAFGSARDEGPVSAQLRLGERAIELQVQIEPPHPQRMREQELGVEPGRVGTVLLEVVGGELQDLDNGQLAAASAPPFSCAARSAAMSADTRSSRSPCMTRSSLCSVRLIRWSVTRLSLKL